MKDYPKPRTKFIALCSVVLLPFWALAGFDVVIVGTLSMVGFLGLCLWMDYLDSRNELRRIENG